jgi:hypothetical protein
MGYYKRSRPGGGFSGYDHADSIADAHQALRRTRTRKSFILTADSPDLAVVKCSVCDAVLADDPPGETVTNGYRGNRCDYFKGLVRAMHYTCSWGALLEGIVESRNLVDAAAAVDAKSGPWTAAT